MRGRLENTTGATQARRAKRAARPASPHRPSAVRPMTWAYSASAAAACAGKWSTRIGDGLAARAGRADGHSLRRARGQLPKATRVGFLPFESHAPHFTSLRTKSLLRPWAPGPSQEDTANAWQPRLCGLPVQMARAPLGARGATARTTRHSIEWVRSTGVGNMRTNSGGGGRLKSGGACFVQIRAWSDRVEFWSTPAFGLRACPRAPSSTLSGASPVLAPQTYPSRRALLQPKIRSGECARSLRESSPLQADVVQESPMQREPNSPRAGGPGRGGSRRPRRPSRKTTFAWAPGVMVVFGGWAAKRRQSGHRLGKRSIECPLNPAGRHHRDGPSRGLRTDGGRPRGRFCGRRLMSTSHPVVAPPDLGEGGAQARSNPSKVEPQATLRAPWKMPRREPPAWDRPTTRGKAPIRKRAVQKLPWAVSNTQTSTCEAEWLSLAPLMVTWMGTRPPTLYACVAHMSWSRDDAWRTRKMRFCIRKMRLSIPGPNPMFAREE